MITIEPVAEAGIGEASGVINTVFGRYGEKARREFSRLFRGEDHPTYVFAARQADKMIGVAACLETYFSMDVYGICWVGVLEEHRRRGVGARLIEFAETFIGADLLNGRPGSIVLAADMVDYYGRLGYAPLGAMHDNSQLMIKNVNA